jgi:hypothetical protein
MDTQIQTERRYSLVTKRECLNRTFTAMATHPCLAIGQTADFAASVLTKSEAKEAQRCGANCICVYCS